MHTVMVYITLIIIVLYVTDKITFQYNVIIAEALLILFPK